MVPVQPGEHASVIPFERSFDSQLGLTYDRIEPEEVLAHLEVRPDLLDRNGRLQGGVFMAAAEGTASMGTAAGVMPDGMIASGMANDTSVVGDLTEGRMTGLARRRASRPDLWTWDVEARDGDGRTCALSKVLIAVRPRRGALTA